MIESEIFDAELLDMNLGGEDSDFVADALSERDVPFFYCSGNCWRDLMEGFRDRAVLHKPFRDADLSAVFTQLRSLMPAPAGNGWVKRLPRFRRVDHSLWNVSRRRFRVQ